MVTIKLTDAEARAVLKAMGNSIDNRDDAKDILLTNASVAAAYRAAKKISEAVYAPKKKRRP